MAMVVSSRRSNGNWVQEQAIFWDLCVVIDVVVNADLARSVNGSGDAKGEDLFTDTSPPSRTKECDSHEGPDPEFSLVSVP